MRQRRAALYEAFHWKTGSSALLIIKSEEQTNAASCVMETFINHRKQIISTVLVALMNSGRRRIQIQRTIRFSPRKRREITKEQGERKMPKDSYLPPSLVFHKDRERNSEGAGSLPFLCQRIPKTITKLRIIGDNIPRRSPLFFFSPPSFVPALIFETNYIVTRVKLCTVQFR